MKIDKESFLYQTDRNNNFNNPDNFNANNTLCLANDLKNHVAMLESMSVDERVSVIRNTEMIIEAYENNVIFNQNLKEKQKNLKLVSKKLDFLHKTIEEKEKKLETCYKESKSDVIKENMTFCEYQTFKRENQINAKRLKMELDDLYNITLSQLKTFKKCENEYQEEKAAHKYIRGLLDKAKSYLNKARFLKMQKDQLLMEQRLKKETEEQEQLEKDTIPDPDKDTKPDSTEVISPVPVKKKLKYYRLKKKKKPKEIIKPKPQPKKNRKPKPKPIPVKPVKSEEEFVKPIVEVKKSKLKEEETPNDNQLEEMAVRHRSSDEHNRRTKVGCCERKPTKKPVNKGKKTDNSNEEINAEIQEETVNSESNVKNQNVSVNEEPKNVDSSSEPKIKEAQSKSSLSKPTRLNSKSKTTKSKSKTPNSRSRTPNSQSNMPSSKSTVSKTKSKKPNSKPTKRSKKSKAPKSINVSNVDLNIEQSSEVHNDSNVSVSLSNLPQLYGASYSETYDSENETSSDIVSLIQTECKENFIHLEYINQKMTVSRRNIANVFGVNADNKYESDTENENNMNINNKKYLSENEIIAKRKNNQANFDSNYPKAKLRRTESKSSKSQSYDDELKSVDETRNIRNERLKRSEQDRLLVKNRDLEKLRSEEKERLNKKMRLQEAEDHKNYLDNIEKNKKEAKKYDNKKIEKRSKVIYDYQKLLDECKNRDGNVNSNLYNIRYTSDHDIMEELYRNEPVPVIPSYWEESREKKEIVSNEEVNDFAEDYKPLPENDNFDRQTVDLCEEDKDKALVVYDENQYKYMEQAAKEGSKDDKDDKNIIEVEKTNESDKSLEENVEDKASNEQKDNDKAAPSSNQNVEKKQPKKRPNRGCFGGKGQTIEQTRTFDEEVIIEPEEEAKEPTDDDFMKSSENLDPSEKDVSEKSEILQGGNEEIEEHIPSNYDVLKEVESDEDQNELIIPDNEINNPKYWKKNIYYVEPKTLFEQKIGCIIRVKPGTIPIRKLLMCDLITSSDEIPSLDQRENYSSYIFRISQKDIDDTDKFNIDSPWHIAIPYYLPESTRKQPLIVQVNEDQNRWNECATYETTFDNLKKVGLKFVETKVQKPFGIYAVVSYLNKDRTVIDKTGTQLTSTSDRNVILSVPVDALKISIHTTLQVTTLDPLFWKEIKEKHEKSALDSINLSSAMIEIEAKRKKLTNPATLTLSLPTEVQSVARVCIKKKVTVDAEYGDDKPEDDDKTAKKRELNAFQKTLLMPDVNSAKNIQDVHFLSFINEEDRWNKTDNPNFNYDKTKEIMQVDLPAIQSSKYILLKSKRKTNDESVTKAAKIIDNELCVRNCVIALLQSTKMYSDFALIVSLKKYFQYHVNALQDEGFIVDSNNKLMFVELKERQILSMEFVGNIRSIIPDLNESQFAFHSLFPNTQKFRVKETDSFAQKAISSFRGYLDIYTKTLVKKPVPGTDAKTRKNQTQYTFVEENLLISHLLISIKKGPTPKIKSFNNLKIHFKRYHRCMEVVKRVASKIGNDWWELGVQLNVPETRMQSIKSHNQEKAIHKMAEDMLQFWLKGCEANENKYDLLKAALKNCGRLDVADRLPKPQEKNLVFGC